MNIETMVTKLFGLSSAPNLSSVEKKLKFLRDEKIGSKALIKVPDFENRNRYKERPILHLDYTASAQGLGFINQYLYELNELYANTHTETSETGRISTHAFKKSVQIIKEHVGAVKDSFVIPVGYGATGAIERMQKILGINMSPKCQSVVNQLANVDLQTTLRRKFVVFVGPYEHHSNDVTWQDDALCDFVRIKAHKDDKRFTEIDFDDLRAQLALYPDHIKIGCFSAASNVTGLKTDVKRLGKILKEHGAMYFLDYAAAGPYADIDMKRDQIDAIFLSAHKNLGGPNLGLLVARNTVYDRSVSPSFGGGGTVQAVTPWSYHFHDDIEEREYSGTPAIRQTWKAALSFELKNWLGLKTIHSLESKLVTQFMKLFEQNKRLKVLGNTDPGKRIGIFSFLVKHGERVIHHNLVASLLNDLFGIQARSGCACAGPFGHELLAIDKEVSDKYVDLILNVNNGFKPGWTRIGSHYTLSNEEIDYITCALNGISLYAPFFINDYDFCAHSGEWSVVNFSKTPVEFGIEHLFSNMGMRRNRQFTCQVDQLYAEALDDFCQLVAKKISSLLTGEANFKTSKLARKVKATLVDGSLETSSLSQRLSAGVKGLEKNSLDRLFHSYLDPKENNVFCKLEQMDKSVRFFYAPALYDQRVLTDNKNKCKVAGTCH